MLSHLYLIRENTRIINESAYKLCKRDSNPPIIILLSNFFYLVPLCEHLNNRIFQSELKKVFHVSTINNCASVLNAF